MPEISVLMGIYNENRRYAALAIDSVLEQTFTDFEFFICDDGSDPAFYKWLKGYCRKDQRIRLMRQKKNRGLASALNRCFRCASGKFIARMDADDISVCTRFEKQAAFLNRHQEYALAGCNVYLIDGCKVWGERRLEEVPGKRSFLYTSAFVHPAVMIRREVMEALFGYREHARYLRVEDYDFFMRMYGAGYVGYNLQEPLLFYREEIRGKHKYRYRVNECRVRLNGFRDLGILRGNLRYVVKPLAVGLLPDRVIRKIHVKKYADRHSVFQKIQIKSGSEML
ncbi:MAG: glycosyltransferase [Eubacterium sp.]|nr:glycosyltransferase [Eubacterium sp.]